MNPLPVVNEETIQMLKKIGAKRNHHNYFKDILDLFCDQSEKALVQLGMALNARDSVKIHHLAHKLKGSSQSIGATSLERLLATLQEQTEDPEQEFDLERARDCFDHIQYSYQRSVSLLAERI